MVVGVFWWFEMRCCKTGVCWLHHACLSVCLSLCVILITYETLNIFSLNLILGFHWFIKKNPTTCNNVSKFYYYIFIWSSTYFGRHTAHHQKPESALATSGFSYVEGCWTLSGTYCAWQRPPTTRPATFYVWKTRGCQCSFRLLMMGGVSLETCWASYKYGIIKFWYIIASCRIFFTNSHNTFNC